MSPSRPVRIVHVIASLKTGGAEMNLYRLLQETDRDLFRSSVISLAAVEPMGPRIEKLGIPVTYRNVENARGALLEIRRLADLFRGAAADVVQTWMYHADFIGGIAARFARVPAVVWGIQASQLDPPSDRTSRKIARVCAPLSRFIPNAIVSNSATASRTHSMRGYDTRKLRVIHSGFGLPSLTQKDRLQTRSELGIPPDALVVGRVGRLSAVKDHRTFLAAAGILAQRIPNLHLILCGDGVTDEAPALVAWARDAGVDQGLHLLGRRSDIDRLHSAMDVACSSSYAEGFPSVVGEAMAAGVPVVATDVGDSALLVGDTGAVVSVRDPVSLADRLAFFLQMAPQERAVYGRRARARIADHFSIELMASSYAELYGELLSGARV